ncbi:MAG: hypothetical protein GY859_25940, partial [Desulfobacterales bacterium]|nr:hypothetical protein [Desulfobacterales bacterium]
MFFSTLKSKLLVMSTCASLLALVMAAFGVLAVQRMAGAAGDAVEERV